LFVDGDRVLLVCKTYGHRWDIPGGYVDRGESPAAACERELAEELGLHRNVQRLLVHDWAPSDTEGDKILYLFDCGELGDDEAAIKPDGVEVEAIEWVSVRDLDQFVIPRLEARLGQAFEASRSVGARYLERGLPRF
jgi:8-oxo-dGTP pyrophosphatase MutT (NUDIX family)